MTQADPHSLYINGVPLDAAMRIALQQLLGGPIPDGRYWYDAICGAWGMEGGPTVAFTRPGLPLPGPMPPQISGGGTGIFFNGRELHPQERAFLLAAFGMAPPGQYLLNAMGVLSTQFGMPIANLAAALGAAPSGGAFSGAGAFGMVDGGGAVVNLPDGTSHVT